MLWDTIAEETSGDMPMEFTSCRMPHDSNSVSVAANNNAPTHHHEQLAIMNSSLHEMTIDHQLSFYNDDERVDELQEERLRSTAFEIPVQMGLLSPEGSPCRFKFVDKSKVQKNSRDFNDNGENTNYRESMSTRSENLQNTTVHARGSNKDSPRAANSLRIFHSLSSGSMGSSSMEEDYMDLFEMDSLEEDSLQQAKSMPKVPSDLDSLFIGQIKSFFSPAHRQAEQPKTIEALKTPEMRRPPVRRCLSMTDNFLPTPKTPETLLKQVQETATSPFGAKQLTTERNLGTLSYCFKRPEPPSKTNSPIQIKRHRIEADKENLNDSLTMSLVALATPQPKLSHPPPLRKSMSMNDAEIMSALARSESKDEPVLIGDFSKPFALPLLEGRHRDLKSISCNTMARLLRGEFDDVVASYRIIDCRYPYEFEGGHIRGAQNLYTHEQIIEEFLTHSKTDELQRKASNDNRRHIIIFHCEFSSERGPKLSRFLRSTDRERNTNCYPTLDYPEIYLLHNGYKEFYEQHSDLCYPVAYRPMLEPAYNSAYRHFRSKSKSWNGDGGLGGATGRLKKSRSRLML